jgi:hypothetical protein
MKEVVGFWDSIAREWANGEILLLCEHVCFQEREYCFQRWGWGLDFLFPKDRSTFFCSRNPNHHIGTYRSERSTTFQQSMDSGYFIILPF